MLSEWMLHENDLYKEQRGSVWIVPVDIIVLEAWADEVAQLEAEIATIKLWGFKPEASALTLGEAITELQDKLHGAVKENQRLREAFKPLLDRALPHQWRGTIEIQCTKDEFLKASKALENAT
jgi:hypothetical protein